MDTDRRFTLMQQTSMKKLLSIVAILYSCVLFAANPVLKGIPSDCEVYKPEYVRHSNSFHINTRFESDHYGQKGSKNGPWDVYSDRDNNTTFYKPSDNSPQYSSLHFKEKVRIARIKGSYALVYTPAEGEETFPELPTNVNWKGWFPLSNLILMDYALANTQGMPVIVLLNGNVDADNFCYYPSVYRAPYAGEAISSVPSNDFYYLIKKTDDYSLIASGIDLTDPNNIYGWIETGCSIEWNDRVAKEPSWELQDNAVFRKQGDGSLINKADNEIGKIPFLTEKDEPLKYNANQFRRRIGLWAMPRIVEIDRLNFSTIAIPVSSHFLTHPPMLSSGRGIGYKEESNGDAVSIMIVIDGSRMYEPFFPILAEAINELKDNPRLVDKTVKIGVTIYHDSRNNEYVTENHPMTYPGDVSLYDFIDSGGNYGFQDNLSESPLISAINESIISGGFKKGAHNYLLIMGGRGDLSDISSGLETIAEALSDNDINVCALQFQNNTGISAYLQFGYFIEDAMQRKNMLSNQGLITITKIPEKEKYTVTHLREGVGGRELFDNLTVCNGDLMPEEEFSDYIENQLYAIINDASSDYSSVKSTCGLFTTAELSNKESGRRLYKDVILYSEEELAHLIGFFSDVSDIALDSGCDRKMFWEALKQALPDTFDSFALYAEKDIYSRLQNTGINKIVSYVLSVPYENTEYDGPKLKDVMSVKTLPESQYRHMLKGLVRTYRRLQEIRAANDIYGVQLNGSRFYWVPVEDLL